MNGGNDMGLMLAFSFGLFMLFSFLFLKTIAVLFSPDIKYIEGIPTKTHTPHKGRYQREQFKLTCNGHDFLTDSQTWGGVAEATKHRLWYSSTNNRVMAFEKISASNSDNTHLYTDSSSTDVTSIKKSEKRKLRSQNISDD